MKAFLISFFCLFIGISYGQQALADTIIVQDNSIQVVYKKPQRHVVTINRNADIRFTIWDNTVEMWAGSYNVFTGRYSQLLINGVTTTSGKKDYLYDSFYIAASYSGGGGGAATPDDWDYATGYDFYQTTGTGTITGSAVLRWQITNTGATAGSLVIPGSTSVVFRPGDSMEWSFIRDYNTFTFLSPPDVAFNATGTEFTIAVTYK
jgi:hypothetical protein